MKTNKLEKRVKQLEEQLIDSKIEKHTGNYIHVPVCNLLALIGTLLLGALAYGNWVVLTSLWQFLNIDTIMGASLPLEVTIQTYQFGILPMIILQYVFVALLIISFVALTKGGYDKLKPFDEEGLIVGLIFGLILGLILGLIVVLILGLILGLIFGLIVGLILGLISGLIKEYE